MVMGNSKFTTLFALLIFVSVNIFAKDIKGKVYEKVIDKKEPLVGANIYWLESYTGTTTDNKGKFNIKRKSKDRTLIASYVGYKPDTIVVAANATTVNFVLEPLGSIDEVVVVSRKAGSHINKMDPIMTQNITGAELCKAACCNLSESFETNASVDVLYSDAVSGAKQIQLLGLTGTYVQMMTENIPNLRGLATPYGLGYIPGSWMEAIQVSKGTSSVKNGYEAITGQINVEYKKPATSEKFFVNGFASSAGKFETNMNGSILLNDKWSTLAMFHFEDMSFEHDDNDDGFMDMPKTRQYNFFNRWHYKPGNGFDARFGYRILKEDRLGGQKEPMADGRRYDIDINSNRFEVFYKNGYIFSDKVSSFGLITSFTTHDQKTKIGLRNYDAKQNSFYTNLIFQSNIGSDIHKYNVGASFKFDRYDETFKLANNVTDITVPGVFGEYTFMPNEKLTALVGVRADFHNEHGTFFTPRFHLKYNPFEKTHVRGSIGKGYRRTVLLAENTRYMASSRQFVIPTDLDEMEEALNYGINITQYINVGDYRKLSFNIEYYHTEFQNKVVADVDSDPSKVIFSNLDGDAYSDCFQIEMNSTLVENLEIVMAYRYNIVKETIDGKLREKPLVSKYKGLFNLSYSTPMKIWQIDFTAQLNGDGRLPNTSQLPAEFQRGERFDAYPIFNAQVTKYFKWGSAYVGVENLGNYTQDNPIVDSSNPFGNNFDSSMIWGPLHGRKFFVGFRWAINRD
jgi:outer membrane receptor for ferrienterochelin and colicin